MKNPRLVSLCAVAAALALAAGSAVALDDVTVGPGGSSLTLTGGQVFHQSAGPIDNFRSVSVPGTSTIAYLWNESGTPFYAISRDGGNSIAGRVRETDYTIKLAYANFDPLKFIPGVNEQLMASPASELHLVQFWTVSLEEYQTQIEAMGGEIVRFMANHTHIVRMPAAVADEVSNLPYVRWTGPFHPAYKLPGEIRSAFVVGAPEQLGTYSIEVFDRGAAQQNAVAARILAMGGSVQSTTPESFRMDATLTPAQLLQVVKMDEVHFMDPRGPLEMDMDIVRQIGGANFIETVEGFTGQGVRGEAADSGFQVNHQEFQGPNGPPLLHGSVPLASHGTAVYGVLFASGVSPQARGLLPDAEQGIMADAARLRGVGNITNRFNHTAQLVDPNGPYRAVFQTNSTGDPRTRLYTTISAAMDDLLFAHDILHCQSMSNANGTPDVRPQAWAKNIVGVGGIRHLNTLNRNDDTAAGSSGPAQDGRIKPDLAHFYDNVFTSFSTSTTGYGQFNGTSSATPITAGHFGLFFQMWHEGVWDGHGGGATVFDSRAHMATAKAMMINSAFKYPLNQGGLSRIRQGWGMADLQKMYNRRNQTFIIDETDLLTPLGVNSYDIEVAVGETEFAVTMVYTDPMGSTSSTQHRINDLSLRVTSPGGTEYWGNNGLMTSHLSAPGGLSNTKDTVENVFVQNPEPGIWTVEVFGDEIVEDSHPETPGVLDADYALVASGGQEVLGVAIRPVTTIPTLVLPDTPVEMTVSIVPGNSLIVPNSEEGHYRLSAGAFTTVPLIPLGNNEFMLTVPAADCGQTPEFYFSAGDANLGITVFLPRAGAAAPFTYDIGELATTIEFVEGFEGGSLPSGWTATGLWNITSSCSPASPCDGTFFAYFGRTSTCTYNLGSAVRATGSLTSPLISVPAFNPEGGAVLTYCYNYEREVNANFDKARVLINGELVDEPDPTNTWETREIDLADYAGQDIRIEFFFDSMDGFSNDFRGFQIDAVTVEVTDTVCGACVCACDFDTSTGQGVCDLIDFLAFQDAFVGAETCACDIDISTGPGVCDLFDFLAFQSQFVSGCP